MKPPIKLLIAEGEGSFAEMAAAHFIKLLEPLQNPLITLPTGLTPLGFYQELANHYQARSDLWQQLRFVALDEYFGIAPGDERLFGAWLTRTCLDPLQIKSRMFFRSDAQAPAEAQRMQDWLNQNGPLDMAVLGLGQNGHIAFNEPHTPFESGVHLVELTEASINANALYWGGPARVPRTGMTLGLSDLAQARHTMLLVKGATKADILARALTGPVTPAIPASYLQTIKNVTIIADRDAASLL